MDSWLGSGSGSNTGGSRPSLPTLYVQNEKVAGVQPNLRFRKSSIFYGVSPSSRRWTPHFETPGTTLVAPSADQDDSGYGGDGSCNLTSVTTTIGFDNNSTYRHQAPVVEEALQRCKKWFELAADSAESAAWPTCHLVPWLREKLSILVALVIISSCFVATGNLVLGLHRLDPESWAPHSHKYQSMEFAHTKRQNWLQQQNRLPPREIRDENGFLLLGKKAAIQFGFDLKRREHLPAAPDAGLNQTDEVAHVAADVAASREGKEEVEEGPDAAQANISMKVVADVLSLYEQLSQDEQHRKDLIQKLSSFGHFTTTKVQDATNDTKPAKPVAPTAPPKSTKEDPVVKLIRLLQSDEDDPFRFV